MHLHDRYALALAMLDGDRDARKVLADLLEEQGERGLAQWARQGRNRLERQLDLAIMLLPPEVALILGAEFLDKSAVDSRATLLERSSVVVQRWVEGTVEDAETLQILGMQMRLFDPTPSYYVNNRDAMEHLIQAIHCLISAGRCATNESPHKTAYWRLEANQAVRHVSRITRQRGESTNWQVRRTVAQFKNLLTSQASPWPK
jgi:hypothetical protein